jgi:hypothetical protein
MSFVQKIGYAYNKDGLYTEPYEFWYNEDQPLTPKQVTFIEPPAPAPNTTYYFDGKKWNANVDIVAFEPHPPIEDYAGLERGIIFEYKTSGKWAAEDEQAYIDANGEASPL